MLDTTRGLLSGCILAVLLACGTPPALSATKGQRVRSSPDIPATDFTCADRPPGYYADLETGCQVYHMCTEGGNQFSYRCPNTTLFQQRMLICAHWYQVNCSRSEQHYGANLLIGQRDKPFVNDDPALAAKVKTLKTLHNPEVLQTLGPSSDNDDSPRQPKAQSSSENIHANNFKRDGGISIGFVGKNKPFHNGFPTTVSPANRRTTENLSQLPLAGSVLPGGVKSFQFSQRPIQGFTPSNRPFRTTPPPQQFGTSTFSSRQFSQAAPFSTTQFSQATPFPPTPTPNTINKVSFTPTTKSSVSFVPSFFTENQNKFQPSGFQKQSVNVFDQDSRDDEPSSEFLPPQNQKQLLDLTVASQENALSGRRTTTTPPPRPPPQNPGVMESLPETTVKAEIEHAQNGSQPVDRFNTFIKRFNPYEEVPTTVSVTPDKQEEPQQEQHVFINRFVPDITPPEHLDNRGAQPEQHVFINRFVLTPEEQKQEKDRQSINNLHNFLPPADQFQINFPKFDLMPPFDDSDDSESNKIELHLNDPRRNLFIPDDNEDAFSRADAAPIVVTIPLHSHQKSPPMWFRAEDSEDPCSRCHPSFIVNKETCMPCVIIR